METLFDKNSRAIIRLYDDWFVSYTEAKHLGWLNGKYVYDKNGKHIGSFDGSTLRNKNGYIIAKDSGSVFPGMAGIPGRPGRPGFGGISGMGSISSNWAGETFEEFFD